MTYFGDTINRVRMGQVVLPRARHGLTTIVPPLVLFLIKSMACSSVCLFFGGCQALLEQVVDVESMPVEELSLTSDTVVQPIIVDVRPEAVFREGHIPGAVRVDLEGLDGFVARSHFPDTRPIVMVSESGWDAIIAAATARAQEHRNVKTLAGGMEAWRAAGLKVEIGPGLEVEETLLDPPVVRVGLAAQVAMTVAGFVIKPLYIALSFLVILILLHQKGGGLRLIRDGTVLFFVGENICSINYFLGANEDPFLNALHGLGMVGLNVLLPWGVLLLIDERIFHYLSPDRTCVMQRFCGSCWKKDPVDCGLHRLSLFLAPALAIVSLIPLTSPIRPFRIVIPVFLTNVPWTKDYWNQILEVALYPILAAIFFLASMWWLRKGREGLKGSLLPFFLGTGFAGFALFRFALFLTFKENPVWSDFWEELTELLTICLILSSLLVFKAQLGLEPPWSVLRKAVRDR